MARLHAELYVVETMSQAFDFCPDFVDPLVWHSHFRLLHGLVDEFLRVFLDTKFMSFSAFTTRIKANNRILLTCWLNTCQFPDSLLIAPAPDRHEDLVEVVLLLFGTL